MWNIACIAVDARKSSRVYVKIQPCTLVTCALQAGQQNEIISETKKNDN
jgi:hypothetical protein